MGKSPYCRYFRYLSLCPLNLNVVESITMEYMTLVFIVFGKYLCSGLCMQNNHRNHVRGVKYFRILRQIAVNFVIILVIVVVNCMLKAI